MSALLAIAGVSCKDLDAAALIKSINLLGHLDVKTVHTESSFLATGQHKYAPIFQNCFCDDDEFNGVVAGDIVNHGSIDWTGIRAQLTGRKRGKDTLNSLHGAFVLTLFDRVSQRLFIVTDPFAWQSVYVAKIRGMVVVSTSLATFFKIPRLSPRFSKSWLYEHLYFNYGVLAASPLERVQRLAGGVVLEYRLREDLLNVTSYCHKARPQSDLIAGQAGIDEAKHIFIRVVPEYFDSTETMAVSLSMGLDCRAVLAAAPEGSLKHMSSLTFGLPESSEILECEQIADNLGFNHIPALLDQKFLNTLPSLIRETVYLSNGSQNINRSHLLYAYRKLRQNGKPFGILLNGVSGDHIFRDHIRGWGNVPHIMSADMAQQLCYGRHELISADYRRLVGDSHKDFSAGIDNALDNLVDTYGEFADPYTYLRYLMFEAGPRYFGGQLALANAFSTFRSPYWDSRIVDLGFRLQEATVGFSSAMSKRDRFREARIQASIVASHPRIGKITYLDLPISVFAESNKSVYQFHRGLRKLRQMRRRRTFVDSENWKKWYVTVLNNEIRNLLGKSSLIREYVCSEFIDHCVSEADVHWLGKLATAELTLLLVDNGWERLDERPARE